MSALQEKTSIRIPAKPEYVGVARLIAAAFAGFFGFDSETLEDIKIAVSEACTTAILQLHREDHVEEKTVEITTYAEDDSLVIDVIYSVKDPATVKQAKVQHGEKDLGTSLMTSIMDKVEVIKEAKNHEVILRMAKRIP